MRPTKGYIHHPHSLVDDFNVKDLVKYYKIDEAARAASQGKKAPQAPTTPYGRPLSVSANYQAHQNYVGRESDALKREAVAPKQPVITTDAKGRKVLIDHTGKVVRLSHRDSDSDSDSDNGFPRSAVTGVRYMSYDPAIDDPRHPDYQDEWVSSFGKLKAEARRRVQHEKLVAKLGYDPDAVKGNARRYLTRKGRAQAKAKGKRRPQSQPLRGGVAARAPSKSGRRRRSRAQTNCGAVSQYNQHKLRPAAVKKKVAVAPVVDAGTGEALVPNQSPVQSPRTYQEAQRLLKTAPVVIRSIGDLEAVKRQHEEALLSLIGHEWRRERDRIVAYEHEPFEFRKKWLADRFAKEREEVSAH